MPQGSCAIGCIPVATLLEATVSPTFVANENATVLACCLVGPRAAVVMKSPRMERGTDVRMGDQEVAEALYRAGRFAVGAGAAVRDRPHDDLALGQDGIAGPGPVGRFERIFAAAPGDAQARPLQASSHVMGTKLIWEPGVSSAYHDTPIALIRFA